jgi:hypothetical protein
MSPSVPDVRFLRQVFAGLLFGAATCVAGVVYVLLMEPSPPAGMVPEQHPEFTMFAD